MAYAGYLIRVGNYTIPKKYIRAEKYDVVLHGQDLDSYRDANGQLQRTALQHTVVDVTFSTPPMMHEAVWRNLIDNIRAQYTNSIEKKCTASVYVPEIGDYKPQDVYLPDIKTNIYYADDSDIIYNEIELQFIGY